MHVFPRLVQVARFPAFGAGCTFSRAWYRLHVFPRSVPVGLHQIRVCMLIVLFASVVIGQSNYFGFGVATRNIANIRELEFGMK